MYIPGFLLIQLYKIKNKKKRSAQANESNFDQIIQLSTYNQIRHLVSRIIY